ncbi:unnamed protein product [Ilex paraguariensis]|uniref:Uncharacterized protein n=1 Tax=Ilex paraguariensis TaxID=185542 RepID=A0ABC8SZZ6_9AQUA
MIWWWGLGSIFPFMKWLDSVELLLEEMLVVFPRRSGRLILPFILVWSRNVAVFALFFVKSDAKCAATCNHLGCIFLFQMGLTYEKLWGLAGRSTLLPCDWCKVTG